MAGYVSAVDFRAKFCPRTTDVPFDVSLEQHDGATNFRCTLLRRRRHAPRARRRRADAAERKHRARGGATSAGGPAEPRSRYVRSYSSSASYSSSLSSAWAVANGSSSSTSSAFFSSDTRTAKAAPRNFPAPRTLLRLSLSCAARGAEGRERARAGLVTRSACETGRGSVRPPRTKDSTRGMLWRRIDDNAPGTARIGGAAVEVTRGWQERDPAGQRRGRARGRGEAGSGGALAWVMREPEEAEHAPRARLRARRARARRPTARRRPRRARAARVAEIGHAARRRVAERAEQRGRARRVARRLRSARQRTSPGTLRPGRGERERARGGERERRGRVVAGRRLVDERRELGRLEPRRPVGPGPGARPASAVGGARAGDGSASAPPGRTGRAST